MSEEHDDSVTDDNETGTNNPMEGNPPIGNESVNDNDGNEGDGDDGDEDGDDGNDGEGNTQSLSSLDPNQELKGDPVPPVRTNPPGMMRNINFPGGVQVPSSFNLSGRPFIPRNFHPGGLQTGQPMPGGPQGMPPNMQNIQQGMQQNIQPGMQNVQQGGLQSGQERGQPGNMPGGPQGMQNMQNMQQGGMQHGGMHQHGMPQMQGGGSQGGLMHGMQFPFGNSMMEQQEKDPNLSDISQSESFSKKRKREDDDQSGSEDEDDSQSSKKLKTEEPGNDESKIHQGMPFENNTMFQPPNMQQMQGQMNQQFPQGVNMHQLPTHIMRGGPYFPGPPGPGGPFFMSKPGFMPGENPNQPPPNWPPQIPFGQNPLQMMYKPENIVEVEPYFQQILMKNPPSDGLTEKLPSSKTPVIDAFIYCAICNWGVMISPTQDRLPSTFTITDFNKYWDYSQKICSKPSPTETPVARLKALRRWFADFPGIKKIKAVKEGKEPIVIKVKQERIADVIAIVKKYSQIINTRCRTLVQSTINHQPSFNNMEGGEY
jgi:hypothetical protein